MTRHWYIYVDTYLVDPYLVNCGTDEDDLAIQVERLCEKYERAGNYVTIEYGYAECSDHQRIVIEDGVVVKRESCF